MARYIRIVSKDDTDVLIDIEKIQYVQKKKDGCVIGFINAQITSSADFDEMVNALNENANSEIEDAPTADVVEVRHGEWIWTENGKEDYEQYWVCSVCKEKTYFETKFCSECGAKMDKGVTE